MKRYAITSIAAMAAMLGLAACAQADISKTAFEECNYDVTGRPADPEFMKLFVNSLPPAGNRAGDILENATALEQAIDDMGGTGPNLAAKIQSVRQLPIASGLAGVPVRSFLDAADHTLQGLNFGHPIANYTTIGRLEAYHYNSSGESCLRVRMTTTAERANGNGVTVAYLWTVFGNFQDATRMGSDPNNVFPDAQTLPISEMMAGDYDHKLWGSGSMIRITKVERKFGSGPFVPLNKNNPLYQVTAASCIDMLFVGQPPPTLPPGAMPPFYCLGRCPSPPIINTK